MSKQLEGINRLLGEVLANGHNIEKKMDDVVAKLDTHIANESNVTKDLRKFAVSTVEAASKIQNANLLAATNHLTVNIDDVKDSCAPKWVTKAMNTIIATFFGGLTIAFGVYLTYRLNDTIANKVQTEIVKDIKK